MSRGPFEDLLGHRSHYDGNKAGLKEARLILETKKDTLTSIVTLARAVLRHQPDIVIGEGQGGIIVLGYSKALQLEVALQARNVQRDECQGVAESWGRVKACIMLRPRLSKSKVGQELLNKSNPEMFDKDYPVPGLRVFAVAWQSDSTASHERQLINMAGAEKVK